MPGAAGPVDPHLRPPRRLDASGQLRRAVEPERRVVAAGPRVDLVEVPAQTEPLAAPIGLGIGRPLVAVTPREERDRPVPRNRREAVSDEPPPGEPGPVGRLRIQDVQSPVQDDIADAEPPELGAPTRAPVAAR